MKENLVKKVGVTIIVAITLIFTFNYFFPPHQLQSVLHERYYFNPVTGETTKVEEEILAPGPDLDRMMKRDGLTPFPNTFRKDHPAKKIGRPHFVW